MTQPAMNRRFGVEIEFLATITREHAAARLRNAGINVEIEGYNHGTRPHWKIITDGSCGYELVSPVLEGEAGLAEAHRAAKALEGAGAKVNRNCGFHVHFDAAHMGMKSVKNLFKLWLKFEDVLDTFQPASRRGRNNRYCLSNHESAPSIDCPADHAGSCNRMFKAIDECTSMEDMKRIFPCRYRKFNLHSFFRHRTLEVRHHSGTVDAAKITNWVRLMARLFDAAENTSTVRNRPQDTGLGANRTKWFHQAVNSKGLVKFYNARARKLAA